MTKYKNYKNKYTKNNIIHTIDNIVKMPFGNVVQREKEFSSQYNQIGFPTDKDMKNSSNVVYVEEYTRDDGTVVHAHWRSKPDRLNSFDDDILRGVVDEDGNKRNDDGTVIHPDGTVSYPVNPNDKPPLPDPDKEQDKEPETQPEKQPEKQPDNSGKDVDWGGVWGWIHTILEVAIQVKNLLSNKANLSAVDNIKFDDTPSPNLKPADIKPLKVENTEIVLPTDNVNLDMENKNLIPRQTQLAGGNVSYSPEKDNILKNQAQIIPEGKANIGQEKGISYGNSKTSVAKSISQPMAQHSENDLQEYINQLLKKENNNFIGNHSNLPASIKKALSEINNIPRDEINNTPDKMTLNESILKWLFTNPVTEKFLPMASHSVMDGMDNLSTARKNPNATVYNSPNEIKDKDLKNKLKSLGVADNAKGIVYNTDSEESKKIANAPEFNKYINEIINNSKKNKKEILEFKRDNNIFSNRNDLYYALQHVTVQSPKISARGETFTCRIIDVSDFEKRPNNIGNIPNNWGYRMQQKGQYKNYYEVFEIKIPLSIEQREKLRKRN